jgi:hypothetical protein
MYKNSLANWKDYYEWQNGEEFKVAVTYLTAALKNMSGTSWLLGRYSLCLIAFQTQWWSIMYKNCLVNWKDYYEWRNGEKFKVAVT